MKKLMTNFIHWNANHKAIPLMLFLLLTSNFITAQVKVSGIVSDDKGLSIPGANITVLGSKLSASTDFDGKYNIDVPANATLQFTFIGFDSKTIAVNGQTKINVTLSSTSQNLKDVVVIGYGTQKRGDINGAVSSVKAVDIADSRQVTVDQMLQGRAAGVVVTNNSGQPGGNVSIRIRGATSLSGSNEPLYIIDGVPFSGDATNSSTSGKPIAGGYVGGNAGSVTVSPLSLINPNDIESFDVLKDASATAIYGSRGANGVVVITTKSGKKGTGRLTYDSYISTQKVAKFLDAMSLSQYATQQNELSKVYGYGTRPEFVKPELLGPGTDWQDEIYKTAILVNHQLSFSGGSENVTYYVSGGYTNQEGVVIGSGYKRYNFKTNLDAKVKEWFKIGANISAGISNEEITFNGSSDGIISTSLLSTPDVAVRDSEGKFSGPPADGSVGSFINPVAQAMLNSNDLVRKNFVGNFYSELKLAKGLEYRFEIGANTEFTENTEFQPTYVWGSAKNEHASYTARSQNSYSLNIKNYLTYKNVFGKHSLNVMVGQEANDNHWSGNSYNVRDFVSNSNPNIHLGDQTTLTGTDYKGSTALYSYYGRLMYDFENKYNVSATMRADGSSKFAEGRKWGYFPAVAFSWKLTNEAFMDAVKKYVDIKFRIGYGESGNQNVPNGAYSAGITTLPTYDGNGFLAANIANPDLTWETSKQTNLGLDFTLFQSKLTASFDIYRKKSSDFLLALPLPAYLTGYEQWNGGLAAPLSNIGSMENKGVEFTINYSNRFSDNFSWNSNFIFGKNVNKLLDVVNGVNLTQIAFLNGYTPAVVTNTTVGGPIGQLYGYKSVGIIRTQEQLNQAPVPRLGNKPAPSSLGDVEYVDINGDGFIDESDAGVIGNPQADFTYGFSNTFKYKTIDLTVFLQGSQGGDILNLTRRAGTSNVALYQNQLAEAADFYTADNTDAKYPRPVQGLGHANLLISDRYVEDASYLRIQNVTLGYSLPSSLLSKTKFSRVRLYAGAQNLYTFTKYNGYDPEVGVLNQNELLRGIDNGRYPNYKTYTLGLNVEF
ncbi:SusC/RagA family TonB-linked outer membrane protein [Flavobacterium hibisci]|uniref:SusC/RagA family TonB-linked outer membrane protein n=1 Tax=Flavobacterium hibisci TaxID=1914462 RepID=UPI001CBE6A3B|nr:TonB-dependent receptor [Flavobacterium hibisci]MBZ4043000.1 TonB-dependent receptor [Flavobacterium hibisci]